MMFDVTCSNQIGALSTAAFRYGVNNDFEDLPGFETTAGTQLDRPRAFVPATVVDGIEMSVGGAAARSLGARDAAAGKRRAQ